MPKTAKQQHHMLLVGMTSLRRRMDEVAKIMGTYDHSLMNLHGKDLADSAAIVENWLENIAEIKDELVQSLPE